MQRFTLPRDLYFGAGAIDYLKTLDGCRAIIVLGGGSMRRNGFLDKVLDNLKEANIEVKLIEDVEPDPSVETVMKGAAIMSEFKPDLIISMGGGSPIDAAKAMWVFYEYPEATFEEICVPFSFPKLRNKARFIAIPSTSGTATEVTAFSVITDYSTGVKWPLADFEITPDIAIVDPDLALTMPQTLTAHTGMDALTHAVEAYVGTVHQPFTDPLALEAIKIVFENIKSSFHGDKAAREMMHYGQCMAGMAFSNALLGIVHSMAHKTGAAFSTGHIPHGCANAIYLPYVIQYNSKADGTRYGAIGRSLGMTGDNQTIVDTLCEKIKEYNKDLGIPDNLREFGIDETEFNEKVENIARLAIGDACTGTNPRTPTVDEMVRLLKCCYTGDKVDF